MPSLRWLPCQRRRRRKGKKKAEQTRQDGEKENTFGNVPSASSPGADVSVTPAGADTGTKVPEPEKPPVVEQTSGLSISQQVWNEAYESIEKDEPNLVEAYMKTITISLQPQEASDASTPEAPDVSAELKDPITRQKTMEILVQAGREKVATASKFTQGVGDFANSILEAKVLVDLAIQNIPQAALPWAGVCVGLQILLNPAKASRSNLSGIAHVSSRMEWYCSLTEHLLNKEYIEIGKSSFQSVVDQLRGRTIELYKALLLYQMKSVCSYYRNQGLNFLRGLVNLDDWDSQLESVTNAEATLLKDSEQYNTQHAKSALGELVRNGEATQSLLGNFHQTLRDYVADQKNMRMDKANTECLRDLHVVDPQDIMEKIEGTRDKALKEAYQWILDAEEYQAFTDWTDKQSSRVLWIKGPAGTGKTMLLIGIIRELHEKPFQLAPGLSYFFCQSSDKNLNNATATLRSLIWLLLIQQPHLISYLLTEHKNSGADKFKDGNAFWSLSRMFKKMLADSNLSPVYLVVDALDECDQPAPDMAKLQDLKHLISDSLTITGKVKWLVSSRPEARVHEDLKNHNPGTLVEVDVQSQEGAVNAYINHKLSTLTGREGYNEELLDEIAGEIRQRANNTFLWVALVFQQLASEDPWNAVQVVQSKPPDLYRLYDDLMTKIENGTGATPQFCKNVLVATCLAHRPLSLPEIAVLAGLPPKAPPGQLVGKCGSFLAIRENVVYLIHQSAREYLEENYKSRLQQGGVAQGHAEFSNRSIEAMSSILTPNIYGLQPGSQSKDVGAYHQDPLAPIRYSCEFWVDHLCEVDGQGLQDGNQLSDNGVTFAFFQNHFLHWIESLSLIHKLSAGILSIRKLLYTVQLISNEGSQFASFLKDAEKFILRYRSTIEQAPLQTYGAPLVFCPTKSEIKKWHWKERLPFIGTVKGVRDGWDPCLQTLEHGVVICQVAFSPDGRTLASSSMWNVKLWDAATGVCNQTNKCCAEHIVFSPDGKTLASASKYGKVGVWDAATGDHHLTFGDHDSSVRTVRLWDHSSEAKFIAFSPDGKVLASSSSKIVQLLDAATGVLIQTFEGHTSSITSIAFSPDGKALALASDDGTVRVWDAATGDCNQILENHNKDYIRDMAFSPNGRTLASVSYKTLQLWDVITGDCNYNIEGLVAGPLAFSPDGKVLASSSSKIVQLFDTAAGALIQTFEGHTLSITSIAFSPDGKALASASQDGTVRVWDAAASACEQAIDHHSDEVVTVALSPDGKTLASASTKVVQLQDVATGVCNQVFEAPRYIDNTIAFSPDGKFLASASSDLTLQLWDIATGDCNRTIEGYGGGCIAFSPDGKILAVVPLALVSPEPGTVKLLDVATGAWIQTLHGVDVNGYHDAIAFSPDGKTVVAASTMTLQFWDTATGTSKQTARKERSFVRRIVFSEDSRYLVTEHGWLDVNSGKPSTTLHQRQPTGLIFVEGEWVTRDGQKMLWLPPDYKAAQWAASDNILAFIDASGRATFLEFV